MGIKRFCKEYKTEILLAGLVVGAVAIAAVSKGRVKKNLLDVTGKNVLTWKNPKGVMNLERVKEILDLNANNSSSFAIFRKGPDPNAYIGIIVSGDVIGAFKD